MCEEKVNFFYNQALFDGIKADLVSFAEQAEELFFSNQPIFKSGTITEGAIPTIQYEQFKHSDETVKLAYKFSINGDPIGTVWWGEGDLQSSKEDLEKTADRIIDALKRRYAFKVFDRNVLKTHLYENTIVDFMKTIGYDLTLNAADNSLLMVVKRPEDKLDFELAIKDGSNKLFGPLGGPLEYATTTLVKFVVMAIVDGRYKQNEAFEI